MKDLEAHGGVSRIKSGLYELTPWGQELHPVLHALGRGGARSPVRATGTLSPDALMVALESTFVGKSGDFDVTLELAQPGFGDRPPDEAALTFHGDTRLARRFLRWFARP